MSLTFLNPFRFLTKRKLERALDNYQESPGEEETIEVIQLLLKCKDYGKAFQYADNGYQRFPTSNDLLELRQRTLKEMSRQECDELTRAMIKAPRPEVLAKIVEIRRSLGEFSLCEKLARRWKNKFPNSWVLQFSIAKYLFQKSLIEKDPRLSSRCLEQLEISAKLNPKSYKTLLYLATLLYQLGSITKALDTAEKLLRYHPNDPKAKALWECIKNSPTDVLEEGDESEAGIIERQRKSEIIKAVSDFEQNPAIYSLLVHQRSGDQMELVHSYFSSSSGFNFDDADSSLSDLIHSLKVSSNRMGIGELKTCILEGKSWQVFFRNHSYRSLMLCTSVDFQEDDFEKAASRVAPEGVMT